MPAHKKIRSGLLAVSFSCLFLLTSCGTFFIPQNGGSGTTCTNCIYIANSSTNDVATFSATNPLTVVSPTNVGVGDVPSSLALTPSGDYLYAGSVNSGIFLMPVNSGGSLGTSALASSSVMPYAMTVDPTGAWLLTASLDVNGSSTGCPTGDVPYQLSVFPIGSAGALGNGVSYLYTTSNSPTYACGSTSVPPTSLTISADGQYVFMAIGIQPTPTNGNPSYGVLGFNFTTSTGVVSNLIGGAFSVPAVGSTTAFYGVAVDPSSKYLFVSTSGTGGGLTEYGISSSGLSAALGSKQSPIQSLYAVTAPATSTGSYVYVTSRLTGQVYGYTYSDSGMTPISGSPYAPTSAANGTIAISPDSTNKYILTINSAGGPNLQQFSIGTGGALTATSTGTTSSGSYQPIALAVTAASGS